MEYVIHSGFRILSILILYDFILKRYLMEWLKNQSLLGEF